MTVETGSTLNDLDQLNPTGSDNLNEGDNHLRIIKSILKSQFPGSAGNGYAQTINANENEMNFLVGVHTLIQSQLDAQQAEIDDLINRVNILEATP